MVQILAIQVRHRVELGHGVTYERRHTRCGKPHCRCGKGGRLHGPYWFAYWTAEGRTRTAYIGKQFELVSDKKPELLKRWKNLGPNAPRGKRWK